MFYTLYKKYRGSIGTLLIPIVGAVAFKFFDADSPKSFNSIFKLLRGIAIEELHQEFFQRILEWLW